MINKVGEISSTTQREPQHAGTLRSLNLGAVLHCQEDDKQAVQVHRETLEILTLGSVLCCQEKDKEAENYIDKLSS